MPPLSFPFEVMIQSTPKAILEKLNAALVQNRRSAANDAISALIQQRARLGQQWLSLAQLALHHGEIDLASAAANRLVEDAGGTADALHAHAVILARGGRLTEARAALATLPTPLDPAKLYTLATLALDEGNLEEARALLGEVVAAQPSSGSAWLSFAMAGGTREPAAGDRLLAAGSVVDHSTVADRVAWHYAAGHVYASRGLHDRAFAAYATGATLRRSTVRYDANVDARHAAVAMEGAAEIAARPEDPIPLPFIVTGLPRSGTTLVEQILVSHSAVVGGGESNLLRLIAQDAGGISAAAANRYAAAGGHYAELGDLYRRLLGERFGNNGHIVDKSLNNSRFLGLLTAVMPAVRIIWVRRDPLDCAWSCFRTHFAAGAEWSLDLVSMAKHFQIEDRLHDQWSRILGNIMLTIPYNQLVDDPAAWTAKILDHCGLVDEPGPYEPHLTPRAVTTSSVTQVRRAINRDGLGVAAPYRRHLQPFIKAYEAT